MEGFSRLSETEKGKVLDSIIVTVGNQLKNFQIGCEEYIWLENIMLTADYLNIVIHMVRITIILRE